MSELAVFSTEEKESKSAKSRARKRIPFVGLGFTAIFMFIVFFGHWVAPYDYEYWDIDAITQPPVWLEGGSWDHLLGTDPLGRDVLSRIIHGSRFSLAIAVSCLTISITIALILGLISGFFGGKVDMIIMRFLDLWMGFPGIVVALLFVSVLGPSAKTMVIYIGITAWPGYTRIIRGECMSVAQNDFIRLAVVAGCSKFRIMFSHIFPNIMNTLIILITLDIGGLIILTAILSFLGLGTQPPTPDWGLMMDEGRQYITYAWWLIVFPGLAILFAVLGFNLVGDWLRDLLDPKQKLR